jgi:hypothetical protein
MKSTLSRLAAALVLGLIAGNLRSALSTDWRDLPLIRDGKIEGSGDVWRRIGAIYSLAPVSGTLTPGSTHRPTMIITSEGERIGYASRRIQ